MAYFSDGCLFLVKLNTYNSFLQSIWKTTESMLHTDFIYTLMFFKQSTFRDDFHFTTNSSVNRHLYRVI